MRLHLLADKIPWFGAHTGYGLLPRYLGGEVRVVQSRTTRNQIRLGRSYAHLRGWHWRADTVYAAAELRYRLSAVYSRADAHHILYGEGHHHYLEWWQRAPRNVIATLHHPPAQWHQFHPSLLTNLKRLQSAIVLYRCDLDEFEKYVGGGRVQFVRHGVDTKFFHPSAGTADGQKRILFAGQNGRNFEMLERVVRTLSQLHPELRFDFLVRDTIRQRIPALTRLTDHPAIDWHERISDEALRALYQNGVLLLLPLDVSGAVNSLLEALACALPIVTTNVGGVCDYGGGTVYPVVENNDDAAMLDLIETYLGDETLRAGIGRAERAFAETYLRWEVVAREHQAAYRALASGSA